MELVIRQEQYGTAKPELSLAGIYDKEAIIAGREGLRQLIVDSLDKLPDDFTLKILFCIDGRYWVGVNASHSITGINHIKMIHILQEQAQSLPTDLRLPQLDQIAGINITVVVQRFEGEVEFKATFTHPTKEKELVRPTRDNPMLVTFLERNGFTLENGAYPLLFFS